MLVQTYRSNFMCKINSEIVERGWLAGDMLKAVLLQYCSGFVVCYLDVSMSLVGCVFGSGWPEHSHC